MKIEKPIIDLLNLRKSEAKILRVISDNPSRSADIAERVRLPRSTTYGALDSLKQRGLISSRKIKKILHWKLNESTFNSLLDTATEEDLQGQKMSVIVHRGREEVLSLLHRSLRLHKEQRLHTYHGLQDTEGWLSVVGKKYLVEGNKLIKEGRIIMERIVPHSYLQVLRKRADKSLIRSYLDQTTSTVEIPDEYFDSPVELIMFRDSSVFLHVGAEVAIEIKNSEVQDLLLSMFRFISNNGVKINPNDKLHSEKH